MRIAHKLAETAGVVRACAVLGVSRATYYRVYGQAPRPPTRRSPPPRALTHEERQAVLAVLNDDRFVDMAPAAIMTTLLDEGVHLCSSRTMYRILAANDQVRERRNQLKHPEYAKPQLLATAPNQVWSWDITKLLTTEKWKYLYLYVILDIYSRFAVGWMVAEHENASHAKHLIAETFSRQGVKEGELVIHSDRGAPMTSKMVAQLLADLVITKSHSRPHVSNDNPFSESHFKTLKYQPAFPKRFSGMSHAKEFLRKFFDWYNHQHRHSGIAMLTPADVHQGQADAILDKRQAVLDAAYAAHPERFVKGRPAVIRLPDAVYINPPEQSPKVGAESAANDAEVETLVVANTTHESESEVVQ